MTGREDFDGEVVVDGHMWLEETSFEAGVAAWTAGMDSLLMRVGGEATELLVDFVRPFEGV